MLSGKFIPTRATSLTLISSSFSFVLPNISVPNFLVQGGDITHGDGTGGESIYGGHFEDETHEVKHNKRLLLSMANHGKRDTNGSQFFINTVKVSWLDKKNVVFGTVLEGEKVIHSMEKLGTYSGTPTKKITIVDAGEIIKADIANE